MPKRTAPRSTERARVGQPLLPVIHRAKALNGGLSNEDQGRVRDFYSLANRGHNTLESAQHMQARLGFLRPGAIRKIRLRPLGQDSEGELERPRWPQRSPNKFEHLVGLRGQPPLSAVATDAGSFAGSRAGGRDEPGRPRLVLHFDVNKTVVISDRADHMTIDRMVNSLLSEAAWGTVGPDAASTWTLDPENGGPSPAQPSPKHTTFGDWVENVQRLPRKERKDAKGSFTKVGHPGEPLRPVFERLRAALRLPAEARATARRDPGSLPRSLREGDRFLLPAFFQLVRHLEATGREYSIVFRTFGSDLPEVAEEFNLFLDGRHPCERPPAGVEVSALARRRLVLPDSSGCIRRSAEGVLLEHVDGIPGQARIEHGFDDVMRAIERRSLRGETIGIQDCYEWWSRRKESDDSGKLVGADLGLLGYGAGCADLQRRFHHVFFDDNIERDRPHIVDCRDRVTGEQLDFELSLNKFIVKSEPVLAIEDPDYFVKALAACEDAVRTHAPWHAGRTRAWGLTPVEARAAVAHHLACETAAALISEALAGSREEIPTPRSVACATD